jgi:4-hydroxy-4-methyl-2-oxoglutarate aldolase
MHTQGMEMPGTDALTQQLITLGVATLAESGALPLSAAIRPMWPGATFAGPAFTAFCAPGDNLALHAAVAVAPRGSVLAIAFADGTPRGYFGEVLTTAAEVAGLVALVLDGTVRDVAAIERHSFPVFARGIALRGATKSGPGSVGGPVVLGGVTINSGDWLVGDIDGAVVVPAGALPACRDAALMRAEKEATFFDKLRAGATTVELLSLDVTPIEGA